MCSNIKHDPPSNRSSKPPLKVLEKSRINYKIHENMKLTRKRSKLNSIQYPNDPVLVCKSSTLSRLQELAMGFETL